jgi:hypothetical protein
MSGIRSSNPPGELNERNPVLYRSSIFERVGRSAGNDDAGSALQVGPVIAQAQAQRAGEDIIDMILGV